VALWYFDSIGIYRTKLIFPQHLLLSIGIFFNNSFTVLFGIVSLRLVRYKNVILRWIWKELSSVNHDLLFSGLFPFRLDTSRILFTILLDNLHISKRNNKRADLKFIKPKSNAPFAAMEPVRFIAQDRDAFPKSSGGYLETLSCKSASQSLSDDIQIEIL
jgi:hypothetical protein